FRRARFPDNVARVIALLYGESFRDFEKALEWAERMKGGPFRETTRAGCLNILGRHDESAAAAQVAIKLDPKNCLAFIHLGTSLYARSRLKDAIEAFRKA